MKRAILLVGALVGCSAHNWLKSPASRNNNKASTAKECPPGNNNPLTVQAGDEITAEWTTNHGGNHFIKLVAAADEDTLATADKLHEKPNTEKSVAVTMPTTAGDYIMQYGWNNYRNCVFLKVEAAGGAGGENTDNTAVTKEEDNLNCDTYCTDILETCATKPQYTSMTDCMDRCVGFPRTGKIGDKTGNTLQCRWYHLHVEGTTLETAVEHCEHAGPSGLSEAYCAGDGKFLPGNVIRVKVSDTSVITALALNEKVAQALQANGFTSFIVQKCLPQDDTFACVVNFETKATENSAALGGIFAEAVAAELTKAPEIASVTMAEYIPEERTSASSSHVPVLGVLSALSAIALF